MISIVPKQKNNLNKSNHKNSISLSSKRRSYVSHNSNGSILGDYELNCGNGNGRHDDLLGNKSTDGIIFNNGLDDFDPCSYEIEIGWFMKEEFPKVCTLLRGLLKDVTDFIVNSSVLRDRDGMGFEDSRVVNFKSSNELLSGLLVIEGWNITEAEINMKFNTNKNLPPIKTSISNNPLRLEQIQSIFYYCNEALEQFDDILSAYPPEEIDLNISNRILDIVLNKLRAAKDQLLKPNNVSFESNLQNRKIFKPSLPSDVIIDFKIKKNSAIILTTALLQTSSNTTNLNNSSERVNSKKKRHQTTSSKSFRRQNQNYEILEQNSVECRPKKLETLCTLIQNAYSIALSCKEKNIVLQSLIYFK